MPTRTHLIFLLILTVSILIATSIPNEAQVPVRCSGPLSEQELTNLISSGVGGETQARLIQFITTCGVSFNLDDQIEGRLKKAGAREPVITAVRSKAPKPQPTTVPPSEDRTRERFGPTPAVVNPPTPPPASPPAPSPAELAALTIEQALRDRRWKDAETEIDKLQTLEPQNSRISGWRNTLNSGRAADRAAAEKVVRKRVEDMMKAGLTVEQVKAAQPTSGFESEFGSNAGSFVESLYLDAIKSAIPAVIWFYRRGSFWFDNIGITPTVSIDPSAGTGRDLVRLAKLDREEFFAYSSEPGIKFFFHTSARTADPRYALKIRVSPGQRVFVRVEQNAWELVDEAQAVKDFKKMKAAKPENIFDSAISTKSPF